MSFFYAPFEDVAGSWLAGYIEKDTAQKVIDHFAPTPAAWYDPEKGYDGIEYRFVDEKGNLFSLYARWGQWRLAGRGLSHGHIGSFVSWANSL